MDYAVDIDAATEKEINISIPSGELNRFIDQEVDKLRKTLVIKGFRKGKVPRDLIKTRYHDSLKAQAMNDLVTESFLKILSEKKWRPVSQAEMKDLEEGEDIKFRLHFEVIPDFEVNDYIGLEILEQEPLPDDFLLEQAINELREQYAEVKETSRPAVVDDFVTMDMQIIGDNNIKDSQKNMVIRIGDRNLPDELNRLMVGAKKTHEKQTTIQGKTYKIQIKKIEEKILPDIDDAFARQQKYEDLKQFKKELLENAKKNEEKRLEQAAKESLSNILLERISFEVPKSLVQSEYNTLLQRTKIPDSESNKERLWEPAKNRVTLDLIIQKIAIQENIRVEDKEIMNLVNVMGMKLNDENRDSVVNYIKNILTRERTMDFIYKNAKISKKSRIISPKEDTNDSRSLRH